MWALYKCRSFSLIYFVSPLLPEWHQDVCNFRLLSSVQGYNANTLCFNSILEQTVNERANKLRLFVIIETATCVTGFAAHRNIIETQRWPANLRQTGQLFYQTTWPKKANYYHIITSQELKQDWYCWVVHIFLIRSTVWYSYDHSNLMITIWPLNSDILLQSLIVFNTFRRRSEVK